MRRAGRGRARRKLKGGQAPQGPKATPGAWALATWLGSGFSPFAPGTAGTAATLPLVWALGLAPAWEAWSPWCLLAALLLFLPAVAASSAVEAELGRHDPGRVVVDEALGTLLTFGFLPTAALGSWKALLAGFLLFRVLDVWKPGPIRHSQALPRGWGIVADDVLAGLLGGLLMRVAAPWLL